jgi:RNA polymerase primary sigma factor
VATKPRTKRRALRPAQIAKAVDEGRESLDLYLDEISRVALLTRDEELELARKAFRGDVKAQERLARHNVRFVVSVAKKFQNRGVPLVDLIGEGNLGLMTAARKFDPDRGVKFISYAVWWIRQAVQAAIARHGRPVRVPLNRTADLSRLGRTTTLLKERLSRMPTTEELARATGLTVEAVRSLSALNTEAVRLDQPTREGEGGERIERFVADQEATDDGQARTLEEIGKMMGVTRERIRQLRDRALTRLREGDVGERLRDLVA